MLTFHTEALLRKLCSFKSCLTVIFSITSCSNSQEFEGEEKEEVPSPPEPDVEPDHPVRPDRERTPSHEEPTFAALSNEEEEEGSLNKVCSCLSAQKKIISDFNYSD